MCWTRRVWPTPFRGAAISRYMTLSAGCSLRQSSGDVLHIIRWSIALWLRRICAVSWRRIFTSAGVGLPPLLFHCGMQKLLSAGPSVVTAAAATAFGLVLLVSLGRTPCEREAPVLILAGAPSYFARLDPPLRAPSLVPLVSVFPFHVFSFFVPVFPSRWITKSSVSFPSPFASFLGGTGKRLVASFAHKRVFPLHRVSTLGPMPSPLE